MPSCGRMQQLSLWLTPRINKTERSTMRVVGSNITHLRLDEVRKVMFAGKGGFSRNKNYQVKNYKK